MSASPKILVLGAAGMLGHKLVQRLSKSFPVTGTLRGHAIPDSSAAECALGSARLLFGINVEKDEEIKRAFKAAEPDVVINAVGIIKQLKEAKDPIPAITINALLPHRLAKLCLSGTKRVRLIHFSTDCVFAGRDGPYHESDIPDAEDLYGRTKLLGEVGGPNNLTLRSSIIGRELKGAAGLVEWFVSQRGNGVSGFARALYTGLTTNVMAELVAGLIVDHPGLEGIWQVASTPINKYELLQMLERHYKLGITIVRDEQFSCDRRLDGSRFAGHTGFQAPNWETMIGDMRADPTPYDRE